MPQGRLPDISLTFSKGCECLTVCQIYCGAIGYEKIGNLLENRQFACAQLFGVMFSLVHMKGRWVVMNASTSIPG